MSVVKIDITEKAFGEIKDKRIVGGRISAVGHTYDVKTDERKDFHILVDIAAMEEQQSEYEYIKVTESIFELKDEFESRGLYLKGSDFTYGTFVSPDEYTLIRSKTDLLLAVVDNCLYRRVELTKEQVREREIEELGRELLSEYEHCNGTWQDKFEAVAKRAIEWMERKGK